MSDERPDSLASQAASWVPPWERAPRPPDPEFAAKVRAGESDDEERTESNLSDDDDDFDPAFERANPAPGDGVPAELPPFPEETGGPPTVDAPREVPGEVEREPTDIGVGPELPLPDAIEEAAENAIDNEPLVDAPLDGDDAGDVFDAAADDDVDDDGELDLPFKEEVPGPDEDEPATDDTTTAPTDGAAAEAAGVMSDASNATDGDATDGDATDGDATDGDATDGDAADETSELTAADAAARGAADVEAAVAAGALPSQPVSRARPRSGIPAQGRGSKGDGVASVEPSTRTEEEERPPMEDGELRAALEAILLVVDEPVAELQLAQIVEQPAERVARMLDDISARYTAAGHGFDLRRAAGGWRLYTRPEYAAYVERFVLDGQSVRLTQAALETLAVVAYKQPVTRSRISAIRGVNCDGVMRTLTTRGLIEECGTEGETGAFLYRTTALFLEKLGLNSVDQLPPLAPFLPDDVEEVLDASG
jgi:segregation and condensation protein B